MSAHSDLQVRWLAGLAIIGLTTAVTLGGCASPGHSSLAADASNQNARVALANTRDADMPDDLGKPLTQDGPALGGARKLSIDMPISSIAAAPAGKAVLEHDLPGLCERPEFGMFKGMSLKALAGMSGGKISTAKLNQVQADLVKVSITADNMH
ncbi:MAG: hypothetical protein WA840_07000 [Caulobacteraceae bacterium]